MLSDKPSSTLSNFSIILIIEEFISLNNKSTPTTKGPPALYVTSHIFAEFNIPLFKAVVGSYLNVLGINAGPENCEVAEYCPSAYLYLYAKEIILSSRKLS